VIVTHELEVTCRCPVDDTLDRYAVTVTVQRILPVEDILAAVESLPGREFQEAVTLHLARTLGASVVTRGTHSGIVTTCSCS
jgi:hypothetical protein